VFLLRNIMSLVPSWLKSAKPATAKSSPTVPMLKAEVIWLLTMS
jgi:hypothetical protein